MFCAGCGYRLFDTEASCPRCGWVRPLDNDGTELLKNSPQNVGASPAYGHYSQPQRYNNADRFAPDGYLGGAPEPPKHKNRANRALIISVSVVCAVVLIVSGLLIFMLFYHNSEDYKTGKAVEKITAGEYDEGLGYIRGLNTPKANAIRDFTRVLQDRQLFDEAFDPNTLQNDDDAVQEAQKRLTESFSSFKASDKLPDKLKSLYDTYSGRVSAMNGALDESQAQNISDAQHCVLAYKRRKEGTSFTVGSFKDVLNISEPAVKALGAMINSDEYRQMKQGCPCRAVRTMDELFQITSAQVERDKYVLNNELKGKESDASMKISNTYDYYNASVGTGLKSVTDESDLIENARKLYTALRYAWTAYCFEIKE